MIKPEAVDRGEWANIKEFVVEEGVKTIEKDALFICCEILSFPESLEFIDSDQEICCSELRFAGDMPLFGVSESDLYSDNFWNIETVAFFGVEQRFDGAVFQSMLIEEYEKNKNENGYALLALNESIKSYIQTENPSVGQTSESGNSCLPSAEPQPPASVNTAEPSGQIANDPSTPGAQAGQQSQNDPGKEPASSGNSGSLESPEEPAASQNPVPVIAAALIIVVIGAAVIVRKRK